MRGGRGPRAERGRKSEPPPPPQQHCRQIPGLQALFSLPQHKGTQPGLPQQLFTNYTNYTAFYTKKIVLIIYLYSVHAPVPGTDLFLVVFIPKDKKGAPGAHRGGGKGRPSPTPMVPPHGKGTGAPRMVWGHSGGGDSQHPWMLWVLHNHRDVNENRALHPRRG